MHKFLTLVALAFLAGIASAADVKPLVINPSTGLQQQLQPTDQLSLPTNLNAQSGLKITNSNTGGAAGASLTLANGTNGAGIGYNSPAYTPYSILNPNSLYFYTSNAAGMSFVIDSAAGPFRWACDGSTGPGESMRLSSSQNLLLGTSTDPAVSHSFKLTGELYTAASLTGNAGANFPPGAAPNAPVNGDFWSTAGGFYCQVNGSTMGPLGVGTLTGPLTAPRIPFAATASSFSDSAGLTYSVSTGLHSNLGSGSQTLTAGENAGNATMNGASNVIIGVGSGHILSSGNFNVVVGQGSYLNATTCSGNVIIGQGAGNTLTLTGANNNVLIGNGADVDNNSRFGALVVGSNGSPVTDAFMGNGIINSSAAAYTIHGTGGSGANNVGAQLILAGGQGTGTALGGALVLQTAPVGVSGSNPNNLVEIARVSPVGNVLIGTTTDPTGTKGLSVAGQTFTSASTTTRAGLTIAAGTAPTAPNNGDVWNDSSQLTQAIRVGGATLALTGTICTTTADGTVANTVTETSLFGTLVGTKTLPANYLKVGKTFAVTVRGIIATTATPTINFKLKLGATVLAQTSGTETLSTIGTNSFQVQALFTCRSTGATGTVQGTALALIATGTNIGTGFTSGMPNGSPNTIDTTTTQVIDLTATWGTAAAGNTITGQVCTIEVLN